MGNLGDKPKDQEEVRFNETLKRMLKTSPKQHENVAKGKRKAKSEARSGKNQEK